MSYNFIGISCPKCAHTSNEVINTRKADGFIYRRRECVECGTRFTTHETIVTEGPWVPNYQI